MYCINSSIKGNSNLLFSKSIYGKRRLLPCPFPLSITETKSYPSSNRIKNKYVKVGCFFLIPPLPN